MMNSRFQKQAGYTLLELAVVLLVAGMFFAATMKSYEIYHIQQRDDYTEFKRLKIDFALNDYKKRYGRYPCPASYTADRASLQYGYETNCTDTTTAPGLCANGVCIERSVRQVTLDDGSLVYPRVRRGSIPFRVLNLTEDDSYDEFGGRFSYAVTELLTDWETFDVERGGIDIIDGQAPAEESMVEPPGSALYFVFSHGADLMGAYNMFGVEVNECDGPMFDIENCNTAEEAAATYRYSSRSEVPVEDGGVGGPSGPPGPPTPPVGVNINTHYDDYAMYKSIEARPVWKMSDEPGHEEDAHDVLDVTDEAILIGMAPVLDEKVNVDGVTAASADYLSTRICNENGGECFESSDIGGPVGMPCPAGQIATGIGNRALRCVTPTSAFNCPPGQYMNGFIDGIPSCSNRPTTLRCAPDDRTICGETRSLAQSPVGTILTITAGDSRSQSYRCAEVDEEGVWQDAGESGLCVCTPSTETVTDGEGSCGEGYTGNTVTTTATVCPSGDTTETADRAACVCEPATNNRTLDCPERQNGSITEVQTITCSGGVANVGPWVETSNTCTCITQDPETMDVPCHENQTGVFTVTRNWNTGTCDWDGWTEVSNTCACAVNTEEQYVDCAAPLSGSMLQRRTSECPSGNWGDWTDVSNTCTCANDQETRPGPACPPGQIGAITEGRTVDCNGTPQSAWVVISNTCQIPPTPPTRRWTPIGSSTGLGDVGPMAGSVCTYSGAGTPTCKRSTPIPGQYLLYNCTCE